ncbi:HVO_0234 family beta-propeller protein [Natrarchaeobius chitinivorans]|uniref:HVO-0234-like beta-propeller domain-containing protein n=1 Tax=Natrarchaeobius chitinivorans TaxID=1679083 RepID=A0A3N6M2P1_NATCH|nr:hypothetical protein [Natrarchaeobius chitinivorans]RQG94674.1 hypothetical protein EA473_11390 [Natrarchaeobius chitinivorans]
MDSIEEKRVFGDRSGALEAYVASALGVVRVRIAGETVGEFGLCARCDARDVATNGQRVAIATDEDVRVLDLETGTGDDEGRETAADRFVDTGFGPSVAVGYDGTDLLAADADGTIARTTAERDGWDRLEADSIASVRAIDADLVATDGGVYRFHDGDLEHAGLADCRDVSAPGVPLAATSDGVYRLGNGWMVDLDGAFEMVAADPRSTPGRLARAHAVSGETLYALDGGVWSEIPHPGGRIVDVGYGETVYAVTEDGRFLVATDDGTDETEANGWRTRSLGVDGVTGLAVVSTRSTT